MGAAVWMQYCTAYGALVPFGRVSSGDFVIITAASSSVGLAALQIVKVWGGISIATTRIAVKRDTLGQATANGVSIFLYGMLSRKPTPFPMAAFGRRIGMFGYTFDELRDTADWEVMVRYIFNHLADCSFKPEIARTFPFDQTIDACKYLERNEQIGKVVISF